MYVLGMPVLGTSVLGTFVLGTPEWDIPYVILYVLGMSILSADSLFALSNLSIVRSNCQRRTNLNLSIDFCLYCSLSFSQIILQVVPQLFL
jgi:hypothetical protein